MGDFLATTDDSGELMDTFHLFGDETTTTTTTPAGEGGDAGEGDGAGGANGGGGVGVEGAAAAAAAAAGGGQSVAKLKTLDGEAFCSCLEMCFEHMVSVEGLTGGWLVLLAWSLPLLGLSKGGGVSVLVPMYHADTLS